MKDTNKQFKAGEIVAVTMPLGIEHYGVYTDSNTVISASKRTGKVAEESLASFSTGGSIHSRGYPSSKPPNEVVSYARDCIGKAWNLFTSNCQHFATGCHGEKRSPQLQMATLAVGAFILYHCLKDRK